MTATPRDLMQRMFGYIEEQVKEIGPRGFQLESRYCTDIRGAPLRFEETKSGPLNLWVSPSFKLPLKAAADHEQRRMVNVLEVLVASYSEQHQITLPAKQQPRNRAAHKSHVKAVT